jgi:HTH-type transcriptional regulator/antitoxin HigA
LRLEPAEGSTMTIRPIRTERDHEQAVTRIEALMAAKPGTREFDELEVLGTLVDEYERKHHAIDPPTPIEAVKFRMEQGQFTRAELEKLLGGSAKTTEVLKRQRSLSKVMIVKLHSAFAIPFESLLGDLMPTRKLRAKTLPVRAAKTAKRAAPTKVRPSARRAAR